MCGIAGLYSVRNLVARDHQVVAKLTRALTHRGPDDEGFFQGKTVSLGMRRLSIIDLSGGHQPLSTPESDLTLVCNGEIYNYIELRAELEKRGYKFQTHSDCETILYLYREHGIDFLKQLRGMYALALWNEKTQELIVARDRLGERPLYYYQDPSGDFYFASEMKALTSQKWPNPLTLNPSSLHQFLSFQYVHEPATLLREIKKVPAGHYVILSKSKANIQPVPYWEYCAAQPLGRGWSTKRIAKNVRETLEETVKIQLRADVPVGVSLSGGIDSSLIAALARKYSSQPMKAYSVGYPGRPENDERETARNLAQHLNLEFHEIELATEDFADIFPKLIFDMDDPIGDIAAFGYYSVAQAARQYGTTVLLSGLGADELFWGYKWVREACRSSYLKSLLRKVSPSLAQRALGGVSPEHAVFFDRLGWVEPSSNSVLSLMTTEARSKISPDSWAEGMKLSNWDDVVLKLLDLHNQTWLASNCLALTDRMSMAHSIETRLPFLDHELNDLVTGFRKAGYRDWFRGHKYLLIEACRDLIPEEIFRRPKRGFTPPVHPWMTAICERYGGLLNQGVLVEQGVLSASITDNFKTLGDISLKYRLCMLEIWLRLYYRGEQLKSVTEVGQNRGLMSAL